MFDHPSYDDHEGVHFFEDPASGLRAIIAVHSTALGPAAGGCRMWAYDTGEQAFRDALRLSQGMSFKNAMAGLPLGGVEGLLPLAGRRLVRLRRRLSLLLHRLQLLLLLLAFLPR